MKKYYVGVDLHKRTSWFHIMDQDGKTLSSKSISNEKWILKEYLSEIPKPFEIAVETTYNWYFLVDLALEFTDDVHLANSYDLKAFAKRNKKTDTIDAKLIADILRKGYLPSVYIPSKEMRVLKDFLRFRHNLVQKRSQTITNLKLQLDKLGITSNGDFATYKRLNEIDFNKIPIEHHLIISTYIEQLKAFKSQILKHKQELRLRVSDNEDIDNLMSIPGLSHYSASIIMTEIGDINRFSNYSKLCSYAGLAPRVYQSGETCKHGPLNKNRCRMLQWILLETAIHFWHKIPDREEKYKRIKKRKGHNTAKIAVARDMLKAVYVVLKQKRRYVIDQNEYNNQTNAALALKGV